MFIIIYRGHDNDLHMVKYNENDLSDNELSRLWNEVRQFSVKEDAEAVAKKQCPYEYEIFEINW